MSGVTFLRKLRQSATFYDLPVIMFTAMRGEQDESQAIYAGAQDYIRKPFEPRSLSGRVQRVLAKRQERHTDLKTHLEQSAGLVAWGGPQSRRIL